MTDSQHRAAVLRGDVDAIEAKIYSIQMSSNACVREDDLQLLHSWKHTLEAKIAALEADNV